MQSIYQAAEEAIGVKLNREQPRNWWWNEELQHEKEIKQKPYQNWLKERK